MAIMDTLKQWFGRAKKEAADFSEKAAPVVDKAKEASKEAYGKAKEASKEAWEKDRIDEARSGDAAPAGEADAADESDTADEAPKES